jgi:CRP/FNR family transcriptional regulator, anaerobic regulatory protein
MSETIQHVLDQTFPFLGSEQELVGDIQKECSFKEIPAGATLVEVDQYIKTIPLIISGKVKVYREDEDGNELFLYYLEAGDACAISFACTLENHISMVRAVVIEDAEIISVPIRLMSEWMKKYPGWYRFVITTYNKRFEELLRTLDSIAFHRMDERLAEYLRTNSQALNTKELKLSHQDIATELNTSREVISRLLKKMETQGMVSLGRNRIQIIDLD